VSEARVRAYDPQGRPALVDAREFEQLRSEGWTEYGATQPPSGGAPDAQAEPAAPKMVLSVDSKGERWFVPEDQVKHLKAFGARVATPEDQAEYALEQEGETPLTGGVTALTGALLGGGTAHLGLPFLSRLAGDSPEEREALKQRLELYKTAYPTISTIGELAGIAGSLALTGGLAAEAQVGARAGVAGAEAATLGARALGAARYAVPAAGIARLGEAGAVGGRMAAQALGATSRTVLGRAAIKAAEMGAQGAVEGALYAGGEATGDALLSDESIKESGEKILTAMGTGALFGLGTGALLGGSGSLVASGATATARGAQRFAQQTVKGAQGLARKSETGIAKLRTLSPFGNAATAETAATREAGAAVGAEANLLAAETEAAIQGAAEQSGATQTAQQGFDYRQAFRDAGEKISTETKQYVSELKDSLAAKVEQAKTPAGQKAAAAEFAYNQAFRGFGLQSTNVQKDLHMNKITPQEMGEFILREKIIDPTATAKEALRDASIPIMAERTAAAQERAVARLTSIAERVETEISYRQIRSAFRSARSQYTTEAAISGANMARATKVGTEPQRRAIDRLERELLELTGLTQDGVRAKKNAPTGISFAQLLEQRKALDAKIWANKGSSARDTEQKLALKAVRAELEKIETNAIAAATAESGAPKAVREAAKEYKNAKRQYQLGKILEEQLDEAAVRENKGAVFGLNDTIRSSGAASVGASVGALALGPVGAAAGGFAAGVGGAIVSKIARERGNAAAAVMLYRMSETGQATRIVQAVDELTRKAASGILTPRGLLGAIGDTEAYKGARKAAETTAKTARQKAQEIARDSKDTARQTGRTVTSTARAARITGTEFGGGMLSEKAREGETAAQRADRFERVIREYQARPDLVDKRISQSVEALRTTSPRLAANVEQNMKTALSFLASKLPERMQTDPFDPTKRTALSAAEAEKFNRYVAYVSNPSNVLDEMIRGKVTPEGAETLRAIAPKVFFSLQVATLEAINDQLASNKPIPYDNRLKLGLIFDIPTDASLRPGVMNFLQANTAEAVATKDAEQQAMGPGPMAKAPARPIMTPPQMSRMDRISQSGPGRK
jgi:hypothetical protein